MPAHIKLRTRYFRAKIKRLFLLLGLDSTLYQPKCNRFLLNSLLAYNPSHKSHTGISEMYIGNSDMLATASNVMTRIEGRVYL